MNLVKALKSICSDLANKVADEEGFICIQKLLDRFNARIVVRPLLVEAAIAKDPEKEGNWLVLIDEERYGNPDKTETIGASWAPRLRYSIAHELSHTIAFHPKDFGFQFSVIQKKGESKDEYVARIEKETDSATPHLLLARKALGVLPKDINVTSLRGFCRKYGVSSSVLLSCLRNLNSVDDREILSKLKNIAIGLVNQERFLLSPVFFNFDENLLPDLIRDIQLNKPVVLGDYGELDSNGEMGIKMGLGTLKFAGTDKTDFILSVEKGSGSRLFVLRLGKALQGSLEFEN